MVTLYHSFFSSSVVGTWCSRLLWALAFACCYTHALGDESQSAVKSVSGEELMRPEVDAASKRDWNNNLKMWGKRSWNNLHGGWGLKRTDSWDDPNVVYVQPDNKRAWSNFQGGWGKRYSPSDDELAMQQLATILDENNDIDSNVDYDPQTDTEFRKYEKRNWNKFNDGWGKRNKWEKFRGSWGKREPAWNNLRGIWGK